MNFIGISKRRLVANISKINFISNNTGLQPVSRPVEQILGFCPKGLRIYPKGIIIRPVFHR